MTRLVTSGVQTGVLLGRISVRENIISATVPNEDLILDTTDNGEIATSKNIRVTSATGSSSTTTGALVVSGGLGVTGNLNVAGSINGGALNNVSVGSVTPASGSFTNLSATDLTSLAEIAEVIGAKTGATGVVIHDFNETNTWYHSGIAANFTVNLTNTPTTNNRIITINLLLIQGATARFASAIQINGSPQTIRWAGYAPPTPAANRFEIQSFSLIRQSSTWTVFGSLTSFG